MGIIKKPEHTSLGETPGLKEIVSHIYSDSEIDSYRLDEAINKHPLSHKPTNIRSKLAYSEIIKQLNQENFNSLRYLKEEYKEFKMLLGGKIPFKLMDYITYEGSPDPLRFIDYSKTYEEFLEKVEPGYSSEVVKDEDFMKVLKEFSGMLPLRRPYEFLIIREILNKDRISVEEAEKVILKYLDSTNRETIINTFKNLSQEFYDSAQKKSNIKLFDYKDDILFRLMSFDRMILNKEFREKLEDVLNYGIIRYEKNFGSVNYGVPFFKLYEQYSMIDTALLSNYEKSHSAFRGSGLLTNGNDFFLYVDLHKDEDIKESINYKDEFISRDIFQWQTPNNTSQDSERGKNIIHNKEKGKHTASLFHTHHFQHFQLSKPFFGASDRHLALFNKNNSDV